MAGFCGQPPKELSGVAVVDNPGVKPNLTLNMNPPTSTVLDPASRRQFLDRLTRSTAALAALPVLFSPDTVIAADAVAKPGRSDSGSQRRWRTAFGLNGFQSSESVFKQTFPIWEVLEFAQQQGFEGIELIPGWLKGVYPEACDDARINSLRSFLGRYNVKAFSIQTFGAEAFQKDRSVREAWVKRFAGLAEIARKAGCECIGYWPGGDLGGQTVDEAIDSLVWSLPCKKNSPPQGSRPPHHQGVDLS